MVGVGRGLEGRGGRIWGWGGYFGMDYGQGSAGRWTEQRGRVRRGRDEGSGVAGGGWGGGWRGGRAGQEGDVQWTEQRGRVRRGGGGVVERRPGAGQGGVGWGGTGEEAWGWAGRGGGGGGWEAADRDRAAG